MAKGKQALISNVSLLNPTQLTQKASLSHGQVYTIPTNGWYRVVAVESSSATEVDIKVNGYTLVYALHSDKDRISLIVPLAAGCQIWNDGAAQISIALIQEI